MKLAGERAPMMESALHGVLWSICITARQNPKHYLEKNEDWQILIRGFTMVKLSILKLKTCYRFYDVLL